METNIFSASQPQSDLPGVVQNGKLLSYINGGMVEVNIP